MVWKGSDVPDASWELLKYITGEQHQRIQTEWPDSYYLTPSNLNVLREWPSILRRDFPTLENVNIEVVLEAVESDYATDDERFLDMARADEIGRAYLEKLFVVGDSPVSIMSDACAEIEQAQEDWLKDQM
jgi:hypothetical protein